MRKLKPIMRWADSDPTDPVSYCHPLVRQNLRHVITQVPDTVDYLVLFGSCRNDFIYDQSDIDIVSIASDDEWYRNLDLELDRKLDIHNFKSIEEIFELAENGFPIAHDMIYEGQIFYKRRG